jgi:GntR family transcriptional regulator
MSTYLALADRLEGDLAALQPGARVASEHELAAQHKVSRLTARAALQELERRFLVERTQGLGTFVARRITYRIGPGSPPSLTETLGGDGIEVHQQNGQVRRVRAPAATREELGLPVGGRVVAVQRRAIVDGEPVTASISHLVPDLVPDLAVRLPREGSLYRTLREEYGLRPARLYARAELAVMPAEVAADLGLSGRPLGWLLTSRNAAHPGGEPLELSVTWLRADRLRVLFELGPEP